MKITYLDKVAIQNDDSIADINKVTDSDMNEIKKVVNSNEDNQIEIQIENERLRADLNGLPKGTAEGENIDLKDSADMRFSNLKISGNSKQETREGYNLIGLKDGTYTFNGITAVVLNGEATLSGTATTVTFASIPLINEITLKQSTLYQMYVFNNITTDAVIFRPNETDGNRQAPFTSINNVVGYQNNQANVTLTKVTFRIAGGINLSNIKCKPMIIEGSNTTLAYEQYGVSPSPDYPSEVESCGDNVNILPTDESEWEQGTISDGNLQDSTTRIRTKNYCPINVLKQTISMASGQNYVYGNINYYKSDKTYINNQYILSGNKDTNFTELTFTPPEGTAYFKVVIKKADDSTILASEISNIKPKLEKGSKVTGYSEHEQGCINEVICNKNYFDIQNINVIDSAATSYSITNKILKVINTTNNQNTYVRYRVLDITKMAGKTLTISAKAICSSNNVACMQVLYCDKDGGNRSTIGTSTTTKNGLIYYTFTLPTDLPQQYLAILFYGSYGVENVMNSSIEYSNIQIKEGSIVTDCEEHKEQVFTIPTQQPMLEDDYFDFGNKKEVHIWNKTTIKGTDLTSANCSVEVLTNTVQCNLINILTNSLAVNENKIKCNLFVSKYGDTSDTVHIRNGSVSYPNNLVCNILKSNLTSYDLAGVQSFFNEKNLNVWHKLATPIMLPFTEEQTAILNEVNSTAKTYKGTTHIYSTDNVGTNKEVRYFKDIEIMMNK